MIYENASVDKSDIASKLAFLKILSLRVTDFMGFKGTREFAFDKQVALIQGINGSGKSSILEALLTSIDSSARVAKIDEVVHRENGTPAKFAEISLQLLTNAGVMEIYTKISSNIEDNKKARRIEKRVTVDGNTYVNKQAQELLDNANLSQIAKVCFVLQNDPGLISRYELDNYKSLVSLFNIDFNNEVDSIFEDIKKLSSEYHDTEAALNSAKGQRDTYDSIVSSKSNDIASNKDAIAKDKSALPSDADANQYSKDIDELSMKLADVKAKIASIDSSLSSKRKYAAAIIEADAKIESLSKSIKTRDEQVSAAKTAMSAMRAADEMSSLLKQFEDIEKTTEESLHQAQISLAKLTTEHDQEKHRFDLISNGICPTCYSRVGADQLSNLSSAVSQIDESIAKTRDSIDKLTSRLAKSKEGVTKFKSDIDIRSRLEKQIEDNDKQTKHDKAEIEEQSKLKQTLETLTKDISDDGLSNLAEEKQSIEALLADIKSKKQLLDAIALKEQSIVALTKSIDEYKAELSKAEETMSNAKSKLDDIQQKTSIAEQAKTIFKDEIPLYALRSMCLTLEKVMSEITTSIGYGPAKITTNDRYVGFLLEEKKSKEMLPIYLCSTFEQNLLQVSAKLAVALCKGYKFLCLDEVDGCATNENAMLLISSILSFAQKYQMQIIIISHEPATKSLIASLDNSSIITL